MSSDDFDLSKFHLFQTNKEVNKFNQMYIAGIPTADTIANAFDIPNINKSNNKYTILEENNDIKYVLELAKNARKSTSSLQTCTQIKCCI